MASEPIGHRADVVAELDRSSPTREEWRAGLGQLAGETLSEVAVVSVHQPLVERAEELAQRASEAVSACWEIGRHPRAVPANVHDFNELAELVLDLAKAVTER